MATFKNFQFQPFIMEAIQDKGFTEPTPVQEKLIPLIKKRQKHRRSIANRFRKDSYLPITIDG